MGLTGQRQIEPPDRMRSARLFRVHAAFDVRNGLADGLNLFRGVVRDVDVELFFEFHHQLDGIERIGAQIVHERRFRRNLFPIDAQLSATMSFTRSNRGGHLIDPPPNPSSVRMILCFVKRQVSDVREIVPRNPFRMWQGSRLGGSL